jgi:glycolate oxidase
MPKLSQEQQEKLREIVGKDQLLLAASELEPYGSDYTEDLFFPPDAVIRPATTEEVSAIVRVCNTDNIPLTVRGAGTGLSGACLPVEGGVVMLTERMNRILDVDTKNFQATVECGLINQSLNDHLLDYGLFYPPDPASKGSCFIGGNIAHNSGGPRALKYGVTRDNVLNLEVVLPNGEVIWTGANTLKNSTGYNLTQLLIGSEGTLAVVTKAVLKLLPIPGKRLLFLAGFSDFTNACRAVNAVFLAGLQPSALELMESQGVRISADALQLNFPFKEGCEAYLLIELDGQESELIWRDAETLQNTLEELGVDELLIADEAQRQSEWWRIRSAIGETVKAKSVYKEEDTVVPRHYLPELLSGVKEIGERYGFETVCYGHAGDGNLHVNILKGQMTDEQWNGPDLEEGIREIFRLCKSLGGTISGEHGIGWVQKKYMNEVMGKAHFELMKGIKLAFDPKGILNPSKIF